jgi:DNA-binding NarL/FixJ family response regulator
MRSGDILIVEDHPFIAEAMRAILEPFKLDSSVVLVSDTASTVRALHDADRTWRRIFLDLDVPGAQGLSLAQTIADLGQQYKCCVVTATDKLAVIDEVKALGFVGYVLKAAPMEEFSQAIRQVMSGAHVFPLQSDPQQAATPRLTLRQTQFLSYVDQGLSTKQIADRCHLSEGSVNNCLLAASRVLGVTSRSAAVAKAHSLGLLMLAAGRVKIGSRAEADAA